MIKIDQLVKSFDNFIAVDHISFEVKPGEVLGFLGPNGAGKSTTMKMLTGFLTPSSGSATIFGHDVSQQPLEAKSLIGYLPEGAPLYADMTPSQFLDFIADIRGLTGEYKQQRIAQVIQDLSLESVLHQSIDTLSKGFKRRVGLAQAIIHDPRVLILDEPTDGLDPNQKQQVRNLIKNLAKDKIVIISTHILEEVNAVCTRAIIIANGKIVADATPEELEARSDKHHAITLRLTSDENILSSLKTLPNAVNVEKEGDKSKSAYIITPKAGSNLLPALNSMIQKNDWPVDELFIERGHLDDVFRKITTQEGL